VERSGLLSGRGARGGEWSLRGKRGATRELGERGCELTLIFVGRVGATSELGEREFEL